MSLETKDFLKSATEEQKRLLSQIISFGKEEQKYADEINKMANYIGGIYSDDGVGIALLETEEDVLIFQAEPRRKLSDIKQQIKNLYEHAVKIGMRDLGIIQRHYEHYVGKPIPND